MASLRNLRLTFNDDGSPAGIGEIGTHPLPAGATSTALWRYRLVDDHAVDLYAGMSDKIAFETLQADQAEQQEKERAEALATAQALPYTIFKTTVITRMTDQELEGFDKGYQAQPLRGRRMWDDCVSLVSTEPYFELLKETFEGAFGEKRAQELLAPIV